MQIGINIGIPGGRRRGGGLLPGIIGAIQDYGGAALHTFLHPEVTDNGGAGGAFRQLDLGVTKARHVEWVGTPSLGTCPGLNGKKCLQLTGSEYGVSVAPASDYTILHDGTASDVLAVGAFPSTGSFQTLLSTGAVATDVGFRLYVRDSDTDTLQAVYNGTTPAVVASEAGANSVRIASVNSNSLTGAARSQTVADSGAVSLPSPSALPPTGTLHVCSLIGGGGAAAGSLAPVVIMSQPVGMSDTEYAARVQMVRFLLNREYLGLTIYAAIPNLACGFVPALAATSGSNFISQTDISGWGNDITVASGTVPMADINGGIAVQGGSGYLTTGAFAQGVLGQPNHIISACEWYRPAAFANVYNGVNSTDRNAITASLNGDALAFAGVNLTVASGLLAGTEALSDMLFDGASSNSYFESNGVEVATSGDVGSAGLSGLTIGANQSGGNLFDSPIGVILVSDGQVYDTVDLGDVGGRDGLLSIVKDELRNEFGFIAP